MNPWQSKYESGACFVEYTVMYPYDTNGRMMVVPTIHPIKYAKTFVVIVILGYTMIGEFMRYTYPYSYGLLH